MAIPNKNLKSADYTSVHVGTISTSTSTLTLFRWLNKRTLYLSLHIIYILIYPISHMTIFSAGKRLRVRCLIFRLMSICQSSHLSATGYVDKGGLFIWHWSHESITLLHINDFILVACRFLFSFSVAFLDEQIDF